MTDLYERFAVPVDADFKDELKALIDARRLPSEHHLAPHAAQQTKEITAVLKPVVHTRHTWRLVGLVAAAVLAVAAAGAVLVLATGGDDSGQSPVATVPAPSPVVPAGWSSYASSRFGYSIQHPPEWTVRPATKDWPAQFFADPRGTDNDHFAPGADSPLFVFVSSTSNDVGQTALATWMLAKNSGASGCEISDTHQTVVDGAIGSQDYEYCFNRDYLTEVLVTKGERFYQIDMYSDAPLTPEQLQLFDQMLASIQLDG